LGDLPNRAPAKPLAVDTPFQELRW